MHHANPSKLTADCVRFTINPLWKHTIQDVTLPIQRIFDYVPIHPSHIKDWLRFGHSAAGLMFPDMLESREPKIEITKSSVSPHSIQADISVYIFRRELAPSHALQPFDPTIWHPTAYSAWHYMYDVFADVVQDKFGERTLFHRVMHTHFNNCGMLFSKRIWIDFGLESMVDDDVHAFMRLMLMSMFTVYKTNTTTTAELPPLFDAITIKGSDYRICAKCLMFGLGMRRCPCGQVYYCCKACQSADWKVHKNMCGKLCSP